MQVSETMDRSYDYANPLDRPICSEDAERVARDRAAVYRRAAAATPAERCSAVETACLGAGFRAGSHYESVAVLIALVAGVDDLRRTFAEIADDSRVNCSDRHVRRAVRELEAEGLITVRAETWAPRRRRGRLSAILSLSIRWDAVDHFHREYTRRRHGSELQAFYRHNTGETPASDRHNIGETPASDRHFESHTILPPKPFPPPPPPLCDSVEKAAAAESKNEDEQPAVANTDEPTWGDAAKAVREAGVSYVSRCVNDARANGYTPAELIDDAYVLQHTDTIGPGALLSKVRSLDRCWPESGIRSAEEIRGQRAERAARIRQAAISGAPAGTHADVITAVAVKRMQAAGLEDQITRSEKLKFDRARASQQNAVTVTT